MTCQNCYIPKELCNIRVVFETKNDVEKSCFYFKDKSCIVELRDLFIKRMTVDSEHNDRRRKDYNQAIFCDFGRGVHEAVWNETTMEMVLQCFDDAVYDWQNSIPHQRPSQTEVKGVE